MFDRLYQRSWRGSMVAAIALLLAIPAYGQVPGGATTQPGKPTTPAKPRARRPPPKKQPPETAARDTGDMLEKIKAGVQLPPPRFQSKLLPLAPGSTVLYISLANYGGALRQAQQIFHQQLPAHPAIRDWWEKVQREGQGPSIDEALDKVHEYFDYLGDELVLATSLRDRNSKDGLSLMIAEVKKPGLEVFLRDLAAKYAGGEAARIVVLKPQELATKDPADITNKMLFLVRPDYLVMCPDLAALQRINSDLDRGGAGFTSSPFGQRVTEAYQGGVETLVAADLQQFLNGGSKTSEKQEQLLRQSGFGDMKYLVIERKGAQSSEVMRAELSFNGPRHGIAAWLAPAAPMGSLDFVSGSPALLIALRLKSLAQIFDELKTITLDPNHPDAGFATVDSMNVRDAVLSKLTGELAFTLDNVNAANPEWLAVLKTNDPDGLEGSLTEQAMAIAGSQGNVKEEGGTRFTTVQVAAGAKPAEVTFAIADGYLVMGSSQQRVRDAIGRHRGGTSFAKSRLAAILPPDHSSVSGVIYEDIAKLMGAFFAHTNPALAPMYAQAGSAPYSGWMYADVSSLQAGTNSRGMDFATIGMIAAVAIPNLIGARTNANEAAAVSSLRVVNNAQVIYSTQYPEKGYAPNLGALGPGPNETCDGGPSAAHACVVEPPLACAEQWCTKNSYRFNLSAIRRGGVGADFVIVATPVSANSGTKSYCSTSDAVIRWKSGPPLMAPITVSECQKWPPLGQD